MDERKEYWIKLFIKKCLYLNSYEEEIRLFTEWCSKTYNVSEDIFKELKEKYTIEDYIRRLIPILDKHFTVEELKESIKFYSTNVGKKLVSCHFLQDIGKVRKEIGEDIEKDFSNKSK